MKKIVAALVLALFAATAIPHDEVVIMDKQTLFKGKMSKAEARFIFTAKSRYWDDGERVTVFHYPSGNQIYIDFVKEVLGYVPSDFTRSLEQQMNSGTGNVVRFVRSEQQMLTGVSSIPGAIGYVGAYFYVNNGNGDVKKILIAD